MSSRTASHIDLCVCVFDVCDLIILWGLSSSVPTHHKPVRVARVSSSLEIGESQVSCLDNILCLFMSRVSFTTSTTISPLPPRFDNNYSDINKEPKIASEDK